MTRVWYVAYGSNLSAARLAAYLAGGCPPGSTRAHPGARDGRLPTRSEPVDLPGTTYLAGWSERWQGAVAFYDPATPGFTAARAYLVSVGQLVDIAAQEMHRVPRDDDPLEQVLLGGGMPESHQAGPGRYETLLRVGALEGRPLLTFTAPLGAAPLDTGVSPGAEQGDGSASPAYLATMATGLRESRGWTPDRVGAYLATLTGRT